MLFALLVMGSSLPVHAGSSEAAFDIFLSQCRQLSLEQMFPDGGPANGPQTVDAACQAIVDKARSMNTGPVKPAPQNYKGISKTARGKCAGGLIALKAAQAVEWAPWVGDDAVYVARKACAEACKPMVERCPRVREACSHETIVVELIEDIKKGGLSACN
jgi:hypothetical protein